MMSPMMCRVNNLHFEEADAVAHSPEIIREAMILTERETEDERNAA